MLPWVSKVPRQSNTPLGHGNPWRRAIRCRDSGDSSCRSDESHGVRQRGKNACRGYQTPHEKSNMTLGLVNSWKQAIRRWDSGDSPCNLDETPCSPAARQKCCRECQRPAAKQHAAGRWSLGASYCGGGQHAVDTPGIRPVGWTRPHRVRQRGRLLPWVSNAPWQGNTPL